MHFGRGVHHARHITAGLAHRFLIADIALNRFDVECLERATIRTFAREHTHGLAALEQEADNVIDEQPRGPCH